MGVTRFVVPGFGVRGRATANEKGGVDCTQSGKFGKGYVSKESTGLAPVRFDGEVIMEGGGGSDHEEDRMPRPRQSPCGGGYAGVARLLPSVTKPAVRHGLKDG
jgi:hypothetical protein